MWRSTGQGAQSELGISRPAHRSLRPVSKRKRDEDAGPRGTPTCTGLRCGPRGTPTCVAREFAALGTYGRITLTAMGSDLEMEIGPDGFTIDQTTAAVLTTGGNFTVG